MAIDAATLSQIQGLTQPFVSRLDSMLQSIESSNESVSDLKGVLGSIDRSIKNIESKNTASNENQNTTAEKTKSVIESLRETISKLREDISANNKNILSNLSTNLKDLTTNVKSSFAKSFELFKESLKKKETKYDPYSTKSISTRKDRRGNSNILRGIRDSLKKATSSTPGNLLLLGLLAKAFVEAYEYIKLLPEKIRKAWNSFIEDEDLRNKIIGGLLKVATLAIIPLLMINLLPALVTGLGKFILRGIGTVIGSVYSLLRFGFTRMIGPLITRGFGAALTAGLLPVVGTLGLVATAAHTLIDAYQVMTNPSAVDNFRQEYNKKDMSSWDKFALAALNPATYVSMLAEDFVEDALKPTIVDELREARRRADNQMFRDMSNAIQNDISKTLGRVYPKGVFNGDDTSNLRTTSSGTFYYDDPNSISNFMKDKEKELTTEQALGLGLSVPATSSQMQALESTPELPSTEWQKIEQSNKEANQTLKDIDKKLETLNTNIQNNPVRSENNNFYIAPRDGSSAYEKRSRYMQNK